MTNSAECLLHRETAAAKFPRTASYELPNDKVRFWRIALEASGKKEHSPAIESKSCAGPERFNEGEVRCRITALSAETVSQANRKYEQALILSRTFPLLQ
jgi:hypothetical protein